VLKKLCAVMLFVFVATLFVSSAVFAADEGTFKRSADTTELQGGTTPTHVKRVNITGALQYVSKDKSSYDKRTLTNFTNMSNDFAYLQVWNPDVGLFYNFPDEVTGILAGGSGNQLGGGVDPIGFTVSPDHASRIVRSLSTNPADASGDSTVGRLFVVSADVLGSGITTAAIPFGLNYDGAAGIGETSNAVSVDARDRRFAGFSVSDIKLVKVYGDAESGKQIHFERVDSVASLTHGKFVVTKYRPNVSSGVFEDEVLPGTHVISPANAYRIIYAVKDDVENFDFTKPTGSLTGSSVGVIVDPVLLFAERPYVKTPVIAGATFQNTVQQVYAWRIRTKDGHPMMTSGVGQKGAGFNGYRAGVTISNDFRANVKDTFDTTYAYDMVWIKDTVLNTYGYDAPATQVVKFPAAIAQVANPQDTAIMMYTIRDVTNFVGKKVSDVSVFRVDDMNTAVPFTFAAAAADMVDGRFAILTPTTNAANGTHQQKFMAATDTFEEGGVYFVALVAKDGGAFDLQQGAQDVNSKNDKNVHFFAFAAIGSSAPVEPELVVTPASASMKPGESQEFTAEVKNSDKTFTFAWSSDNEDVATVEVVEGVVTVLANKVGEAKIKCVATEVLPAAAGIAEEPLTKEVTVTVAQDAPSGGSSGGCSVGGFAPATLLLLAPLFLLLKK